MQSFISLLTKVDYTLLNSQRQSLSEAIDRVLDAASYETGEMKLALEQEAEDLEGLWNLLASIQDAAEKEGLWVYPLPGKEETTEV